MRITIYTKTDKLKIVENAYYINADTDIINIGTDYGILTITTNEIEKISIFDK